MVAIDEAGPATSVVTDTATSFSAATSTSVIGYISSGNCSRSRGAPRS